MFITLADLSAETRSSVLSQATPDELDAAIAYANDIAASLIARQYRLPLAVVPASVKGACVDIARRRLEVFEAEDTVQKAADAALRWLRDISNGVAVLILPDDPATSTDENARPGVLSSGNPLTYSRASLAKASRSWEL